MCVSPPSVRPCSGHQACRGALTGKEDGAVSVRASTQGACCWCIPAALRSLAGPCGPLDSMVLFAPRRVISPRCISSPMKLNVPRTVASWNTADRATLRSSDLCGSQNGKDPKRHRVHFASRSPTWQDRRGKGREGGGTCRKLQLQPKGRADQRMRHSVKGGRVREETTSSPFAFNLATPSHSPPPSTFLSPSTTPSSTLLAHPPAPAPTA